MSVNFGEIIDRKKTDSLKYDFASKRNKPEGLIPMWVADMDFKTPGAVLDALRLRVDHGIFGYSDTDDDYFEILQSWFLNRFKWDVSLDWLIKTPGIVYALCQAVRAYTKEGEAVIIQQPVYYPFATSVTANNRKLVINRLIYNGERYSIDFDDFEEQIIKNNVKLFILCNPHNPVGRVWTLEELTKLGNICIKYGVTVLSDEIHADFTYYEHKHLVFSNLNEKFSQICVTCTSPTKTFNLAGLQISNIFIKNKILRSKFINELESSGYSQPNLLGFTACKAAYKNGSKWLEELKAYITGNLDFLRAFFAEKLPQIKLIEPQGTYLVWLDFSALKLNSMELQDLIINKAGLWLDNGEMFGQGGEGFERINIACPRQILQKALQKIEAAVKNHYENK